MNNYKRKEVELSYKLSFDNKDVLLTQDSIDFINRYYERTDFEI